MYINKVKPLNNKVWLSSPTMHGPELKYMSEAYNTNWMSTVGENINQVEKIAAEKVGVKYAVGLACCTAAIHLAVKILGEYIYGPALSGHGSIEGKKVFCTDLTFAATVNPILYEGGIPVFIDSEFNTWNMNPIALEKAFKQYPDTKLVVCAHLYGTPADIVKIKKICQEHNAYLIEDAAESMGSTIDGIQTGSFGDISVISYNGNKMITGSGGGCLLTNNQEFADKARKLSTQAREPAAWYQHEMIGYNYRMSNVIAGVIRGQYEYLEEHIKQKQEIYERYKEGLTGYPVEMNPYLSNTVPNNWLSVLTVNCDNMSVHVRDDLNYTYIPEHGKSCPDEILKAIIGINAEGRPIWKPMHRQPIFYKNEVINKANNNYIYLPISEEIFDRGLCLPSDNKMKEEDQKVIIETIKRCFD